MFDKSITRRDVVSAGLVMVSAAIVGSGFGAFIGARHMSAAEEPHQGQAAYEQVDSASVDAGVYEVRELSVESDAGHIYGEAYVPATTVDAAASLDVGEADEANAAAFQRFPLVIISHGLGNTHTSGASYAQLLAQNGYAAYVFDFRGGSVGGNQSDGDSTSMSVMTEADDLEAVIAAAQSWDFVDTSNIVLMGGSQGGMVTAVVAARNPQAAKAVILLYPALSIVDDTHARFTSLDDIPQEYSLFGWLTVGRNYSADIWDYDVYNEIGNYTGPVLIVHGANDSIVDISYSEQTTQTYADAELHEIEGAGHGFTGSAFGEACGYILDFLAVHVGTSDTDVSASTGDATGTAITVTIDGVAYPAHLNDTAAAAALIAQLPLTLSYRTFAAGFDEKIGDLPGALDLGDDVYANDPNPGDIAYWSPQPRVVLYYGDVGSYNGINVIGSFDDVATATAAIEAHTEDFEATIALV